MIAVTFPSKRFFTYKPVHLEAGRYKCTYTVSKWNVLIYKTAASLQWLTHRCKTTEHVKHDSRQFMIIAVWQCCCLICACMQTLWKNWPIHCDSVTQHCQTCVVFSTAASVPRRRTLTLRRVSLLLWFPNKCKIADFSTKFYDLERSQQVSLSLIFGCFEQFSLLHPE